MTKKMNRTMMGSEELERLFMSMKLPYDADYSDGREFVWIPKDEILN